MRIRVSAALVFVGAFIFPIAGFPAEKGAPHWEVTTGPPTPVTRPPGGGYDIPCSGDSGGEADKTYATLVRQAILDGNRQFIADNIDYPIRIRMNKKWHAIRSKRDFLRQYDKIFSDKLLKSISDNDIEQDYLVENEFFGFSAGAVWMLGVVDVDRKTLEPNGKCFDEIIAINTIED